MSPGIQVLVLQLRVPQLVFQSYPHIIRHEVLRKEQAGPGTRDMNSRWPGPVALSYPVCYPGNYGIFFRKLSAEIPGFFFWDLTELFISPFLPLQENFRKRSGGLRIP